MLTFFRVPLCAWLRGVLRVQTDIDAEVRRLVDEEEREMLEQQQQGLEAQSALQSPSTISSRELPAAVSSQR